jgi:dihydrofolate synthase/folylpolyglutamate synthase
MKLGLAAIDTLCERIGRPERNVPSVLVGGTNGKGSTAATLSAIAKACGLRAGLYTSPHLIHVTERIRVEDEDITGEELDRALERVFAAADEAPAVAATYFEAATAAAFLVFSDRRLDLAILEVGLGGRFDATNVAPAVLSAVTSIGLDHTEELGPTVAHIAREKAGIFRTGRPAIARAAGEALEVLRAEAQQRGSAWHDAGAELSVRVRNVGIEGTRFDVTTPLRRLHLTTPLPGAHQAWNAAIAIRAAELLPEPAPRLTPRRSARGSRASVGPDAWAPRGRRPSRAARRMPQRGRRGRPGRVPRGCRARRAVPARLRRDGGQGHRRDRGILFRPFGASRSWPRPRPRRVAGGACPARPARSGGLGREAA